ncbi:MAG: CPBP family intramembrane glutamic endopeptidase [Candidatus Brachytrichaceae bacterium NZ_4S206]|jgi:membrane protease YdiL (CAAX protease family)
MSERPVVWFYILACGIAWLGWIPAALGSRGIAPFDAPHFQFLLILPAIAPALAAAVVTRATYGAAASNELFKALVRWQVGPAWYLVAIFGPLVLLVVGRTVTNVLRLTDVPPVPRGEPMTIAPAALIASLLANPWEEVGWRGFALPHLQKQHTALIATLIVGGLWGVWHTPVFFWIGNPMSTYPFLPWFVGTVAVAFIYTWLYNSTAGSLLPVTLFHVASNTFGVVITGVSVTALAIVYALVALVLIVVLGSVNLSRGERVRMR